MKKWVLAILMLFTLSTAYAGIFSVDKSITIPARYSYYLTIGGMGVAEYNNYVEIYNSQMASSPILSRLKVPIDLSTYYHIFYGEDHREVSGAIKENGFVASACYNTGSGEYTIFKIYLYNSEKSFSLPSDYLELGMARDGKRLCFMTNGSENCYDTDTGAFKGWSPLGSSHKFVVGCSVNGIRVYGAIDGVSAIYTDSTHTTQNIALHECRAINREYNAIVLYDGSEIAVYTVTPTSLTKVATCVSSNEEVEFVDFNTAQILAFTGSGKYWIIEYDGQSCEIVDSGAIEGGNLYTGWYVDTYGGGHAPVYNGIYYGGYLYALTTFQNGDANITLTRYTYCPEAITYTLVAEDGELNLNNYDSYNVQIVSADSGIIIMDSNKDIGGVCVADDNSTQYRVTFTGTINGITFTRTKYISRTDNLNVKIYLPDSSTALFYTLQVTDASGAGLSGYKVSVEKYISSEGAYVPISEMYTAPDGTTSHFLQPSTFYKIKVVAPDGTVKTYDWYADPNLRTVRITWSESTGTGGTVQPPEINRLWDRITYSITPVQTEWEVNDSNLFPITITFNITDANSGIQYYYMRVTKWKFGTPEVVLDSNVTGNPSGGTVTYDINDWGRYVVEAGFYLPDYNTITITKQYIISRNALHPTFVSGIIGDTTYIFLILVLAVAATALFTRVAPDYAGVAGLTIISVGTILHPTAQVGMFPLWAILLISAITYIAWKFVTARV